MDRVAYSRCVECDSDTLFMDGSRCAACLSAIQVGMDEAPSEETSLEVLFFDPVEGVHHTAPELLLKRAA